MKYEVGDLLVWTDPAEGVDLVVTLDRGIYQLRRLAGHDMYDGELWSLRETSIEPGEVRRVGRDG